MKTLPAIFFLLAFSSCDGLCAENAREEKGAVVSQDITIKGKGLGAPPVEAMPPEPDAAVVDEVVESLSLYRSEDEIVLPKLRLSALERRLRAPFPEPPFLLLSPQPVTRDCSHWRLEARSEDEVLWRAEGAGPLRERMDWNGTDEAGRMAVRAGGRYHLRLKAERGAKTYVLETEPVDIPSLIYHDAMGSSRMEISLERLFSPGSAKVLKEYSELLDALAEKMDSSFGRDEPLRMELRVRKSSPLNRKRAQALRRYAASHLMVNPERIRVELSSEDGRGEALSCLLPIEKGATIRTE
ncbi:MAG: hypothetical protein WCU88_13660 [Elusimicrobiota bacterium]|jgi:hypothetical protein